MKFITRSQGPDQKEIVRKKLELEEVEQELAENELVPIVDNFPVVQNRLDLLKVTQLIRLIEPGHQRMPPFPLFRIGGEVGMDSFSGIAEQFF